MRYTNIILISIICFSNSIMSMDEQSEKFKNKRDERRARLERLKKQSQDARQRVAALEKNMQQCRIDEQQITEAFDKMLEEHKKDFDGMLETIASLDVNNIETARHELNKLKEKYNLKTSNDTLDS